MVEPLPRQPEACLVQEGAERSPTSYAPHGVAHEEFKLTTHTKPLEGGRHVEGQHRMVAINPNRDQEGVRHEQRVPRNAPQCISKGFLGTAEHGEEALFLMLRDRGGSDGEPGILDEAHHRFPEIRDAREWQTVFERDGRWQAEPSNGRCRIDAGVPSRPQDVGDDGRRHRRDMEHPIQPLARNIHILAHSIIEDGQQPPDGPAAKVHPLPTSSAYKAFRNSSIAASTSAALSQEARARKAHVRTTATMMDNLDVAGNSLACS